MKITTNTNKQLNTQAKMRAIESLVVFCEHARQRNDASLASPGVHLLWHARLLVSFVC